MSAAEQDASTGLRAVELVERVGRGDPSAEEEVAGAYRRRILLMMLSRTRERAVAEDLTQEALIAVLGALRGPRGSQVCLSDRSRAGSLAAARSA